MSLKGLGKGLGALLGDMDFEEEELRADTTTTEIPLDKIDRNEEQPRKNFDEVAMNELVNSIRVHGVITPIILVEKGDRYMIIAGERRWRASKRAGLKTIPAIVRKYTPQQIREISLIENIQREDLNPIETANAIKQLMDECDYTQEQVAERIGKSRPVVANTIGLLTLPQPVIDLIASGRLSAGHAKVLISLNDPEAQYSLALKGADGKLSVRKFEELVKSYRNPKAKVKQEQSIELKDLVARMQRTFATKVSVLGNDKKGRIYIDYYNRDDLDRIAEILESLEVKEI
ncbi:MAG: ParB/RepB/Spo0J family partition protein [Clostridiales bacterium]|nr:ParB/RepB/Spo0J family partition protein [Clostridiales bacterium]